MNLGLNRCRVEVVRSNPSWGSEYETIAAEIRQVAKGIKLEVEHIGSTSVPGLAAKPIIDVGLLIAKDSEFENLRSSLELISLEYRGDKGSMGGQLFVRESAYEVRTHHIHLHTRGSPEWDRYLVFRDKLRANNDLRDEYGALKEELAQRFENDRFAYMNGKSAFVSRVLALS